MAPSLKLCGIFGAREDDQDQNLCRHSWRARSGLALAFLYARKSLAGDPGTMGAGCES